MGKRRTSPVLALLAVVWCGFFIHACAAGPIYDDPTAIGDIQTAPRVQVSLGKALRVESVSFAVRGPYTLLADGANVDSGDSLEAVARFDGGIRIGDRVVHPSAVRVNVERDGDLEVAGTRYRGDLLIVADEDRQTKAPRVTLVNDVDLEGYLRGVVGKEMSLSASEEALKAQVIAARTYAVYEMRNRTLRKRGEKFDLFDDEGSQMYGGSSAENGHARRLVDETRGLFALWNGKVFKTYYSSTCGGHTESAKMVLGGETEDIPPLGGTECGFCEGSKYYRWSETFPKADLVRKLFPDKPMIRIKGIRISKTLPGGHAYEVALSLEGTSREVILLANESFRRKIDPRKIRSTLWEKIEDRGDAIVLTGRGWGHGAGMCQVGAYRMADQGRTASQILEHYYPQAKVRKVY